MTFAPPTRSFWTIARAHLAAVAALLILGGLAARADGAVIKLDESTPGTSFDGIIDGFPGIAPLDGTADSGGNALAVAFKAGVTEERGIAEFSLAPLAGVSAGQISSAVLTFNVDDVLSTFGPSTDFDGTAAERIFVAVYAGDGAVGLDDFGKGSRVATVNVGAITDASLGASGPVKFEVDITAALKGVLGASHVGIVFSTDDSPTGTSLDDLGVNGAGPPGVNGATKPFITVTTTGGGATPTPGGNPTPTPQHTPAPHPTDDIAAGLFSTAPEGRGDQLVFYYDARDGFTTFLNLHNPGDQPLTVSIVAYGPDLTTPFDDLITLEPGTTRTLDVSEMKDRGLPAQLGVAFATAVDGAAQPIVTRSLAGNFTVANLATSSAWGAHAAARVAVQLTASGVVPAPLGAAIDGASVVLRAIRPERLSLATYYAPDTLQAPEQGGNQIIFVSFNDVPGDTFGAAAAPTRWTLTARRNDGQPLEGGEVDVAGVQVKHIEELLGDEAGGAAGSVLFTAGASGAYNRMVFFTESLGTFATGYLLPHVAP